MLVKAKVLDAKGILISDPRVQRMNDTCWAFEHELLKLKEERRAEEFSSVFKAARRELINLLGLNMLPLEDPETGLLRRPAENEYIPLAVMTARDPMIEALVKKNDEYMQQEQAAKELKEEEATGKSEMMSPEELDAFMGEDIVFVDDPEELKRKAALAAPETKWMNDHVVKVLETEREVKAEKEAKHDKDTMKVTLQSEKVEMIPVSRSKRRVVISSE